MGTVVDFADAVSVVAVGAALAPTLMPKRSAGTAVGASGRGRQIKVMNATSKATLSLRLAHRHARSRPHQICRKRGIVVNADGHQALPRCITRLVLKMAKAMGLDLTLPVFPPHRCRPLLHPAAGGNLYLSEGRARPHTPRVLSAP